MNHSYAFDCDDSEPREPREQDVRRLKPHEVVHHEALCALAAPLHMKVEIDDDGGPMQFLISDLRTGAVLSGPTNYANSLIFFHRLER
jgi:hypothetical protein